MEKVYDDSNFKELLGDGEKIEAGGDTRLFAAMPKPDDHNTREYSAVFSSRIKCIPRNEWSDRIKEQKAKRMRVSDFQKFKAHDQNGLPSCWRNGPAHAATTTRVIQGNPLVYISANSLCPNISPRVGGYEGNAVRSLLEIGGASVDVWPNNSTDMSLTRTQPVIDSRGNHKALEVLELETFDEWATAALLGLVGAIAYDWWRHVISTADLVEIERGSFGLRPRNNWGDGWGEKNDHGFGGYVTFREGKGTPSSGFVFYQMQSALK